MDALPAAAAAAAAAVLRLLAAQCSMANSGAGTLPCAPLDVGCWACSASSDAAACRLAIQVCAASATERCRACCCCDEAPESLCRSVHIRSRTLCPHISDAFSVISALNLYSALFISASFIFLDTACRMLTLYVDHGSQPSRYDRMVDACHGLCE